MNFPPKLRKCAGGSSGLAPLSRSLPPSPSSPEPGLKESTSNSLTPQPRGRSPAAQDPTNGRRSQNRPSKKSRHRSRPKPLRQLSQKLVGRNPGFGEALQKRDLRALYPHPTHPARKQRERKPQATRTPTRQIVRADAARPHERQSRTSKKRAPHEPAPKSFPWASNSECSMGTLFASPTSKLGGWLMALGGRFLQARFSPMPP